jgi:hypothetical protein
MCIVFIDSIDSCEIVHVQKVETLLQKCVDWVVVDQNGLLLDVPVRLGGL